MMIRFDDVKPIGDRLSVVDLDEDSLKIKCKALLQDDANSTIEEFLLEFTFTKEPEHRFPKVRELQGKIPIDRDRHVNDDGTFCLAVVQEEILQCKRGIEFEHFVDEVLLPFLANQTLISRGIKDRFIMGEYPHGEDGIIHYYLKLFPNIRPNTIAIMIWNVIKHGVSRNRKCPCGSKKNIKNCHIQQLSELMEVGSERLEFDLNILYSFHQQQTPPQGDV